MKTLSVFATILGMIFGLAATQILAEEKTKDDIKVKGNVVSGVNVLQEEQKSSKFFEYRDVPKGFVLRSFDLNVEKANSFFTFRGANVRQADSRYDVAAGRYGTWSANFTWNQIPHRFSYFAKTLYGETQPGVFRLPDQLQALLQGVVGDGADNSAALMPAARALMKDFLTGVHDLDLGLNRHKATLKLSYSPSVPFSVNLTALRETREGNRPFGASYGFSHVVELPEPIHYKTTEIDAAVEYSKKWGTVRAGVNASMFENDVQTVIWDNPYRFTDQTFSGAYSPGNGAAFGRLSLAPSNTAQQFYLNGVVKIFSSTRLNGSVSFGSFSQDEKLLPFTTNTSLADPTVGYAQALSAPRATAEAKANITSLDFTLTSKILRNIYLTAGYRFYDFANHTEELDMPAGYARFDQVWEAVPIAVEPFSFARSRLFASLTYHLLKNTSLKVGYSFSSIKRKEGEETHEAGGVGENKNDEGTFKISVDSNPLEWLDVRLSYLTAKRDWSLDGKEFAYAPYFNFKRYFEASRNRQGLNALVGLSFIKNLDVQVSYMFGKDDYQKSDYGLKNRDFTMVGLDLSYPIGPNAALVGFYSREEYKGNQASRQTGSDVFSPDPGDDWGAEIKDTVNTFGGGFNTVLKKDRLTLDLICSYSQAVGRANLSTASGGLYQKVDAIPYVDPLDKTILLDLQLKWTWKLTKKLSLVFGGRHEQYRIDDITRNDWKVDSIILPGGTWVAPYGTVSIPSSSSIFLGALEPRYAYTTGFLQFIYKW